MKKSEGGSGGRRGHSNMNHWDRTAQVKSESSHIRRTNDHLTVTEFLFDGWDAVKPTAGCHHCHGTGLAPSSDQATPCGFCEGS